MTQADTNITTPAPAVSTRRRFLTQAAGVAAGSAALIGAASVACPAVAAPGAADDAVLLRLEEQIFEAWEAAHAHDDETYTLDAVRRAEYERLLEQEKTRGQYISHSERWDVVFSMPEVQRLDALVVLSEQHDQRMADLIDEMWAIPATTEAGRSAKVGVLLACIMDWRQPDDEMNWHELRARRLLIDLVGGEEAESYREIYAS